ncbi:iron complex transport system permease protein [Pseudorhizobium tarimense]|uniref:Iron complex transport system permease protein n=1 Tax=Pseudorhizobium tarimense TaxID=1079109 RepID=A0ABV2H0S0_9HYPH|nr:iron ABC transporter permease [Pseudorhizobium tarimense]MCJ8517457.1 iron ABC transporter permease [Pseudorhizobium tarimense]
MTATTASMSSMLEGRRNRARRRQMVMTILLAMIAALFLLTLMLGQSFTPPAELARVLIGEDVPGVSFSVWQLRLPRAVLGMLTGLCFGFGGAAFQVMLRNPLASPDIIGINLGASAAAVFAIVVLQWNGPLVSVLAVLAGIAVALAIYGLSFRNGVAGSRIILVGIGVAAMLESFIAYTLTQAPSWNLQEAIRWLSGSLNSAQLSQAVPVLVALVVFGGLLLSRSRDLDTLTLGDDTAAGLGTDVAQTRIIVMVAAVGLISVATAIVGPVSFAAFLSGSIAARLLAGNGSVLVPAALVGAALVLLSDYVGQFLLPSRYPVGVVTGALGAPYLIFLIVRLNRTGGSL